MNLQNRLSKLETAQGGASANIKCPVCDALPQDEEKPAYDESIWRAREYVEMNHRCEHCGRSRRIIVQLVERRNERAA